MNLLMPLARIILKLMRCKSTMKGIIHTWQTPRILQLLTAPFYKFLSFPAMMMITMMIKMILKSCKGFLKSACSIWLLQQPMVIMPHSKVDTLTQFYWKEFWHPQVLCVHLHYIKLLGPAWGKVVSSPAACLVAVCLGGLMPPTH